MVYRNPVQTGYCDLYQKGWQRAGVETFISACLLFEMKIFPSRPNMQRCHIVMEFQSCSDSALPSVLQLTILVLQTIIPILIRFSQRSFKFRAPLLGEEDISIPVYLDPASVILAAEFIKYSIACLKLVMARVQEHQSSVTLGIIE